MEKYMGNKSKICDTIFREINKNLNIDKYSFFDVFSGTTNVSKYFKKKGCSIICNDINDMSYVLGKCYIENNKMPEFTLLLNSNCFSSLNLRNILNTNSFKKYIDVLIKENKNTTDCKFLKKIKTSKYIYILTYLTFYSSPSDYDNIINGVKYEPIEFINNNYCEFGNNSRYINLVYKKSLDNLLKSKISLTEKEKIKKFYCYPFDEKELRDALVSICKNNYDDKIKITASKILSKNNITGNRMFFSSSHAKKLDCIINTILFWKENNLITLAEYYILLCSILETIAIFSNTSATYQAFYKEYKANTLQPFRLVIPELIFSNNDDMKVYQEDAVDLIEQVVTDVAYFDPPYNWRQYDSNYHLLNSVAKLHKLNVSLFEKNIVGASGENRVEKLKYTNLNLASNFEKCFLNMLLKIKCTTIAISYSDSESNHIKGDDHYMINIISDFIKKNPHIFDIDSFRIVKVKSKNFESRKGNKKTSINEVLILINKLPIERI